MRHLAAPALLALGLAACSTAGERQTAAPAPAAPSATPAAYADGARAVGAAEDCVQLSQIREARVRDDQTIDFHLTNDRVLRNSLPNRCPQLGFEKAFSYSTSLSRLCAVDIITVIVQAGGPMRGASCGLGKFQPVELPAGR